MSTYAYVNPVIAVFLGWALLGEVVTSRMFLGTFVVVAGVITITLPQAKVIPKPGAVRRLTQEIPQEPAGTG